MAIASSRAASSTGEPSRTAAEAAVVVDEQRAADALHRLEVGPVRRAAHVARDGVAQLAVVGRGRRVASAARRASALRLTGPATSRTGAVSKPASA